MKKYTAFILFSWEYKGLRGPLKYKNRSFSHSSEREVLHFFSKSFQIEKIWPLLAILTIIHHVNKISDFSYREPSNRKTYGAASPHAPAS